jgi:thiol-disulfide isomerase/thioredoxin
MARAPHVPAARLLATAVTLFGCYGWRSNAEKVQVVNGVYKLEESNFETALKKYPVLMVNFYAPWCGGCNGYNPKYEKAARRLRKQDMPAPRLAKVDVTVESKLEKAWDAKVNVEPIVLVFKNGKLWGKAPVHDKVDDIVEFISTVNAPVVIGEMQRYYLALRGAYKELVTLYLPKKHRKLAITAFPVAGPFLFVLVAAVIYLWARLCMSMCCGKAKGGSRSEASKDSGEEKKKD